VTMAERRASTPAVAHNTLLSVTAEQGLIGLALLFNILVLITVNLYHCGSAVFRVWLSTLAPWLVGASTLTFEATKCTWLMIGLFAAYVSSETLQRVGLNSVALHNGRLSSYAYHAARPRV